LNDHSGVVYGVSRTIKRVKKKKRGLYDCQMDGNEGVISVEVCALGDKWCETPFGSGRNGQFVPAVRMIIATMEPQNAQSHSVFHRNLNLAKPCAFCFGFRHHKRVISIRERKCQFRRPISCSHINSPLNVVPASSR
jgi:hypothetical protein